MTFAFLRETVKYLKEVKHLELTTDEMILMIVWNAYLVWFGGLQTALFGILKCSVVIYWKKLHTIGTGI